MLRIAALSGLALLAAATPANAQEDDDFRRAVAAVQARIAPIDEQAGRIPGRALVFAQAGEDAVLDVQGVSNVDTATPANADTPFYIASMTKAFVGLLAVRLDAMGVLPLDTTLAEIYPDMRVEGVDLTQVTLEDALSHRLGFHAPAVSFRTSYTDAVPVSAYAAIVSGANEPVDPAFSYSNLGYVLYGGAVEQRTGRSWKSWLDELVLQPLGMRHSSARSSDLPQASHTHEIYNTGWRTYAPKTDDIMHAAGGLFVSATDMGSWLSANAGAASAIGADIFDRAHTQRAVAEREDGPVRCSGYALGWAICEAGGVRFLEHGGTYTGMRSEMIVLPEQGVGFAVMFNSDSMTGGLGLDLVKTFVLAYAGETDDMLAPAAFAARYAERADGYRDWRSEQEAGLAPGDWRPDADALVAYGGSYEHPQLGALQLFGMGEGELGGTLNGTSLVLTPLAPDQFAVRLSTSSDVQELKPQFDPAGHIGSVDWGGDIFIRN